MITTHLLRPEEIVIEEVDRPVPGEREVLIRVCNVGICGSDIHAYYGRHPYINLPIIQGHEFSGKIAGLGPEVQNISMGERVTVVPMLHCRQCTNCLRGEYNRCSELRFIGCQSTGAMAEYVVVPEDKCVSLPDEIDYETGALIEPLAVAIHAVTIAGLQNGDNLVVMGSGTIGLMTLLAARAMGAGRILQTDILPHRLSLAQDFFADIVCNTASRSWVDDMNQSFGPEGADIIFECVGASETIQEAIQYAPRGKKIIIVGVFSQNIPINIGYVQDHELEIRGVAGYTIRDFLTAIRLITERKIQAELLRRMITDRFSLRDIWEAYKHIERNQRSVLKVMLNVS